MKHKRISVLIIGLALLLTTFAGAQAATRELVITVPNTTGQPVPVAISFDDLRTAIGLDFPANWDSIRVYNASGQVIPYQIDDIDLSGSLSGADELSCLATGNITIKLNDEDEAIKPRYANAFTIEKENGIDVIRTLDGQLAAEITPFGTVNLVKAFGIEDVFVQSVGALRYAGWPESRWYTENELGPHREFNTFEEPLRLAKQQISTTTPVRVVIINKVASDVFPGLRGTIAVSVWATGEVSASYNLKMGAYTDLTKLMPFVGGVMANSNDASHILPAFRWLDWAEEQGISSAAYYKDRDAIISQYNNNYIIFPANKAPQPLFWGASYIFASAERWRTNYSAEKQLGLAEMLPILPAVPTDLVGKLEGVNWHLEGEWRTGYFRWIADEIVSFRKNNNIPVDIVTDMVKGDWTLHSQPSESFNFLFYYVPYQASDAKASISFLENRYAEIAGVDIGQ